ncbi:MAG: hypothetical protein ACJ75K_04295, partial [Actinomycetes bacterium]
MRLADRGLLETAWETDPPASRPPRHLYRLTGPGRAGRQAGRRGAGTAPPRPAAAPGGDRDWRAHERGGRTRSPRGHGGAPMNRTVGRVGGLAISVVAAAPFVYLWVVSM